MVLSVSGFKSAVSKMASKGKRVFNSTSTKAASIFSKTPKALKTTAKVGGAGLLIAALGYGVFKLGESMGNKFNKNNEVNKPEEKNGNKVQPEPKPEPKPAKNTYTVKKGDNVWNIAKQDLKNKHKSDPNYKPTNAEIARRTQELIKLNNLHYEKDNYTVIIHPNDKLKLA